MIKDVIRLKCQAQLSHEQIATTLGISKGAVTKYVSLASVAGLDWETVQTWSEQQLATALQPRAAASQPFVEPDWSRVHRELDRKGMTLMLLWQEYVAAHPGRLEYAYACKFNYFERTTLVDGVRLVPLQEVPPSGQLTRLMDSMGSATSFMGWNSPRAALMSRRTIAPFVVPAENNYPGLAEGNAEYIRIHQLHTDLARVLALLPSLPLIVEWWFVYDDPDLHLAASMDGRRSWPTIEVTPGPVRQPTIVDAQRARDIAVAYLKLTGTTKEIVDRALDRLRQAQARHKAGDAAVEVFTALEALLGDGETNELSHKMSTRAVRLLGGSPAARARAFSAFKKFYGVRSKIMHTGTINPAGTFKLKPDNEELSLDALSALCITLCASVLEKILHLGAIPKWGEFDITEQEAVDVPLRQDGPTRFV